MIPPHTGYIFLSSPFLKPNHHHQSIYEPSLTEIVMLYLNFADNFRRVHIIFNNNKNMVILR